MTIGLPAARRLDGMWVGLSGAVPDVEERERQRCSEAEIHATVGRLVLRVLEAGANLVYGSHPTFTDVIEGVVAGILPASHGRERVRMYVARRFCHTQPDSDDAEERRPPLLSEDEYLERHGAYAKLVWVGQAVCERQLALDNLRSLFINDAHALVCIGGRGIRPSTKAGVDQEVNLAQQRNLPLYLVARYGGRTRTLYDELMARTQLAEYLGKNRLTSDENAALVTPIPPSEPLADVNPVVSSGTAPLTSADVIDVILDGLLRVHQGSRGQP
jgi:SLOG-like protein